MTMLKTDFKKQFNIKCKATHWNLTPETLAEESIKNGHAVLSDKGALVIETGEFTGRSPKDKFVVKDKATENTVDWNAINIPFSAEKFDTLYNKVCDYLKDTYDWIVDNRVKTAWADISNYAHAGSRVYITNVDAGGFCRYFYAQHSLSVYMDSAFKEV